MLSQLVIYTAADSDDHTNSSGCEHAFTREDVLGVLCRIVSFQHFFSCSKGIRQLDDDFCLTFKAV